MTATTPIIHPLTPAEPVIQMVREEGWNLVFMMPPHSTMTPPHSTKMLMAAWSDLPGVRLTSRIKARLLTVKTPLNTMPYFAPPKQPNAR